MVNLLEKLTPTSRHYVRVVASVVFGIALGAFLMNEAYPHLRQSAPPIKEVLEDVEEDVAPEPLSREWPTRLRIPRLEVDAPFETPLELNADGTIMVPEFFDTVGWYKLGASPGEKGTAAILGHVDSVDGAAVFYYLGKLAPGDEILVDRADGTTARFEVEVLERYRQSEFPNEKVYSMTDYPSLRLITCSGEYDKGSKRYSHNTVVYARFAGVEVSEE
jgi:sortase (surface protein transpeptidase)